MAQLINLTSEALQATVRRLLPSQQGFGEDLQATNVVTPIIDLTPTAEGSVLRQDLQRAWGKDSTQVTIENGTANVTSAVGFISFSVDVSNTIAGGETAQFAITDGISSTNILKVVVEASAVTRTGIYTAFVPAGNTLTCTSAAGVYVNITSRQVADLNGVLVPPSGYNPQ